MTFEADTEAEPLSPEQEAELKALAVTRGREQLAEIDAADSDEALFYVLPRAAIAAVNIDEYDRAIRLAQRALALAPGFKTNWNYGNAIHYGHTVLGLVALHQDDVAEAIWELEKAGATRGSPQLNCFGPTMQLAKALLRRGEFPAVLTYLDQCRSFWKMGDAWLDVWERKVRDGQIPNCFMHSYR